MAQGNTYMEFMNINLITMANLITRAILVGFFYHGLAETTGRQENVFYFIQARYPNYCLLIYYKNQTKLLVFPLLYPSLEFPYLTLMNLGFIQVVLSCVRMNALLLTGFTRNQEI